MNPRLNRRILDVLYTATRSKPGPLNIDALRSGLRGSGGTPASDELFESLRYLLDDGSLEERASHYTITKQGIETLTQLTAAEQEERDKERLRKLQREAVVHQRLNTCANLIPFVLPAVTFLIGFFYRPGALAPATAAAPLASKDAEAVSAVAPALYSGEPESDPEARAAAPRKPYFTPQDPRDFVWTYFDARLGGSPAKAWAMLAADWQATGHGGDADRYFEESRAESVCNGSITSVRLVKEEETRAEVEVTEEFGDVAGCSFPEKKDISFALTRDRKKESWRIVRSTE